MALEFFNATFTCFLPQYKHNWLYLIANHKLGNKPEMLPQNMIEFQKFINLGLYLRPTFTWNLTWVISNKEWSPLLLSLNRYWDLDCVKVLMLLNLGYCIDIHCMCQTSPWYGWLEDHVLRIEWLILIHSWKCLSKI